MRPTKESVQRRKPFLIRHKFIVCGKIILPGDKSIAHRALILSALTSGKTTLKNFPIHDDSLATLKVLGALGVRILRKNNQVFISGNRQPRFSQPRQPIFVNNSGTTLRLILGILAAEDFETRIIAGKYLRLRPMARVTLPLRLMGAKISARKKGQEEYAPLTIRGGKLKGITYRPAVASAQVKAAILFAGLSALGKTKIIESLRTRDHTERLLKIFGANITINRNKIILNPNKTLVTPGEIYIPADISSAAFFMVLAAILPGSKIIIEQVSLNPTRSGIIEVLKRMKAKIKVTPFKKGKLGSWEPLGEIAVSSSHLRGVRISSSQVPYLIDELPIIMVAACFARGTTIIKGVGELRVKETDRINSMVSNLKAMGAAISVDQDKAGENIVIKGGSRLHGATLKSFGDHRTAMSMVVAAMAAEGKSRLDDIHCVNKSFPGFIATLNSLLNK